MKCENTSVMLSIKPIAYIHSDFSEKFGIPRQSGLVDSLQAKIIFTEEFRMVIVSVELRNFLICGLFGNFRKTKEINGHRLSALQDLVAINEKVYLPAVLLFAQIRSDYPVSVLKGCSKLSGGPILYVSGADLLDGTPIYDIKPYLSFADAHPDALGSFSTKALEHRLNVHCEDALLHLIPKEKRQSLLDCLSLDPRPSYQHDPERIYGMQYAGFDIHFQ